jgi:hypothetical protein
VEVWNSTYRDWRSKNGRGGDFLVYSDMKILRRDPPDTFMFPLSTQLP